MIESRAMKVVHLRAPYKKKQGRIFSWITLLLCFSVALTTPVVSPFVKDFVDTDKNVSFVFAALSILVILSAVTSTMFFKRFSRIKIFKVALLVCAVTFILVPFFDNMFILAALGIIHVWFRVIIFVALSLFVYDYTNKQNRGEEEGIYYTFNNLGYLIGPFVGGYIGAHIGYGVTFGISGVVLFLTLLYFMHQHLVSKHAEIKKQSETKYSVQSFTNFKKNAAEFFRNGERRKAYFVSLGLQIWFCFKYTYVPLYIIYKGLHSDITGIILSVSIIPMLLLEKSMGSQAYKFGYKKLIPIGFVIYAFMLFLGYASDSVLVMGIFLILANFGTAMIEPLKDLYILDNTKKEDEERFFGIFSTSGSIGNILTPIIGGVIFMYGSYELLFIVFAIIHLLIAAVLASAFAKKLESPYELPQE